MSVEGGPRQFRSTDYGLDRQLYRDHFVISYNRRNRFKTAPINSRTRNKRDSDPRETGESSDRAIFYEHRCRLAFSVYCGSRLRILERIDFAR